MTPAPPLLTVEVRFEPDVVLARQRARQLAALLGLGPQDQTHFATAVSEVTRNAYRYAGGGRVEFWAGEAADADPARGRRADRPPPLLLFARVRDRGPGIPNLGQILDGQYRSATGMGLGIIGTRRLSDHFEVATQAHGQTGTTVVLGKRLPHKAVDAALLARVAAGLAQRPPDSAAEEVQQQNRELLVAMHELSERQAEVERLNAELGETNRGVLALYAELDDHAQSLRATSELKSRFLSDVSHELRTPLNAMISLAGLLLDRVDGELSSEQERQVKLIRRSAEGLREMVGDLLDLAKIEAGKFDLHPSEFSVADVLSALRGMFRPLFAADGPVALVVEEPAASVALNTDEQMLSQVLRNFVSNALKFTERGEVRVRADVDAAAGAVTFAVADTGIGIDPEDQERVFRDFAQVDGPVQRRSRGTGLGLPLSRKLAALLGGRVALASEPGRGSVFSVTIPLTAPGAAREPAADGGGTTDHGTGERRADRPRPIGS